MITPASCPGKNLGQRKCFLFEKEGRPSIRNQDFTARFARSERAVNEGSTRLLSPGTEAQRGLCFPEAKARPLGFIVAEKSLTSYPFALFLLRHSSCLSSVLETWTCSSVLLWPGLSLHSPLLDLLCCSSQNRYVTVIQ
jgi:hypothetical protein